MKISVGQTSALKVWVGHELSFQICVMQLSLCVRNHFTRRSDRKNAPYKPETELILGASYCPDLLPHLCHSPSLPFNNDLVQWDPNHQYPETYNSIAPLQTSWDWRASQGPATPSVDQTVAWGAFTPFSLLYLHWAQICIDFWCLPCPSQPLLVSFLTGSSLKRTLHL